MAVCFYSTKIRKLKEHLKSSALALATFSPAFCAGEEKAKAKLLQTTKLN